MRPLRSSWPIVLLLGLFVVGCQQPTSVPVAEALVGPSQTQAPVEGLRSLVVWQGDAIAEAYYFDGNTETSLNHVRSVTKSVMTTLVGIALEEGFLTSLDHSLGLYLSEVADLGDKGGITVQHLLTMTGGFEWQEVDGPEYTQWILSDNQIQYVLDKPLVATPGTLYNYNSGATHLLSAVLTQATGMSTLAFADRYLFRPIGLRARAWERDQQGFYNGGAGLEVRPTDLGRLGRLYLQAGMWAGQQVVPADWVATAKAEKIALNFPYGPLRDVDYGYLWWLENGINAEVYFAWGYGGQFIVCVPSLDLVVTTTAAWRVSATVKEQQETAILDLIMNRVIPAYR